MKPKVYVDYQKSIITAKLVPEMTLEEVEGFLEKFEIIVQKFNEDGIKFSVLNDAAEKSFADLNAVRKMSERMRSILKPSNINKLAIYRPQDDFHTTEESDLPDKIKAFVVLEDARTWLLGLS